MKCEPIKVDTYLPTTGIVDPIRITLKEDLRGLGKAALDDAQAEAATSRRLLLETEKAQTAEITQKKEEKLHKEQTQQQEVQQMILKFYCELCCKQYTNAMQYEQHLSSYAHNHKKRLADLKQMDRQAKKTVKKKTPSKPTAKQKEMVQSGISLKPNTTRQNDGVTQWQNITATSSPSFAPVTFAIGSPTLQSYPAPPPPSAQPPPPPSPDQPPPPPPVPTQPPPPSAQPQPFTMSFLPMRIGTPHPSTPRFHAT
eukprot:TRINITY_DN2448_c0_g1_i1.p1 TRINITY_DN2448_c0_g1~~TRINITY_DN2448_c0_g1_i1.p1  ORF type:complete len:255 (+),score=55.24 TRINITY_DN2448_c0_g1_i1:347-1111(+)